MRSKYALIALVLVALAFGVGRLSAAPGTVDPPSVPGATNSFTLEDIYNRLLTGAAGAQSTFTEPAVGPGTGTMHTLNQIMAEAPAIDNTNGATETNVLDGKTFWGLTGGQWGTRTGTMPDREGDNASTAQAESGGLNYFTAPDGYYDGNDRVSATDAQVQALDADIIAGNIKSGVNIFGVGGTLTPGGTATAADLFNGQTAHLAGDWTLDTGTLDLACNTATFDGTANQVANAYDGGGNGNNRWCMTNSGDAAEADIAAGKKAWVDGSELTGTGAPDLRFTDNGDGTVTDNHNGFIWLKNAACEIFFSGDTTGQNYRSWSAAVTAANSLENGYCGLSDGSSAGNWRLPEVWELFTLVDPRRSGPALPDGHPFTGVSFGGDTWSNTSTSPCPYDCAWNVHMGYGTVHEYNKISTLWVWPVRGP